MTGPAQQAHVLVIDDVESFCAETRLTLESAGFRASMCTSPKRAVALIDEQNFDLVITTLVMREMSGFDVIRGVCGRGNSTPIIMVTGYGTELSATEAIRLGASDYLNKPISSAELVARAKKVLRTPDGNAKPEEAFQLAELVSQDPAMKEVFETVRKIARTDSRVLIEGETGTGKQLVARAIHAFSARGSEPLVELNCAAIPDTLLESELFGHEKGAFTGAAARWVGRFEEAGRGTLFLDEIGEMGYAVQSKLLQVLQDGTFIRVGGKGTQRSEARIIAATNRDLQKDVEEGRFRADLFYRLNVISMFIPPLVERPGDIPLLANLFLKRFASAERPARRFTAEALEVLKHYRWPGNVRELENVVERIAVLHPDEQIGVAALPERIRRADQTSPTIPAARICGFKAAKTQFELDWLRTILQASQGNMAEAARRAGMDRAQFFRMVKRHDLAPAGGRYSRHARSVDDSSTR